LYIRHQIFDEELKNLKGGLNDLAEALEVERIGPQHQAGSDSLLTGATFFKLRQTYFDGCIEDSKYLGVLYGLNAPYQNAISSQGGEQNTSSSSSLSTSASSGVSLAV